VDVRDWIPFAVSFGLAAGFCLISTPLAMKLARKWGFLDRPNTALKRHATPVPYLGGAALFLGFFLSLSLSKVLFFPHAMGLWPAMLDVFRGIYSIALGGFLSLCLGLVDDAKALTPKVKFLGQIGAALVLMACGIRIQFVREPWLSAALTVLWVVGISNALNFVDIMDGLAAGVAGLAALGFFAFSVQAGRYNDSIVALALAGSCLGFLAFNFAPAKVYMGDAGSLFLGFTLAAIAINEGYSSRNLVAVFSPVLILALPIFDMLLMSVIRLRKGIPPWKGSPDHIPLRLRALGLSKVQTVLALYAATAALTALALGASRLSDRHAVLVWAALGLAAVFAGAWLMGIPMPHDKQRQK
jgi:UDP-GlcNAc:undecaprenyl-phosphate/decaprenyl-phosphate GlcNAc-1-phosphate transferase